MLVRALFRNCLFTAALLGGIALEWHFWHADAQGADGYHSHVKAVVDTMAVRMGDWASMDTPVLPAAVALLRPNVILERHFENLRNGLQADLLLVQCRDARDLQGHYPPICYPANGYEQLSALPDSRDSLGVRIDGISYEFAQGKLASRRDLRVFDFMILPDGKITPDMNGVYQIARNRHERHFGAAQIQIITNGAMSEQDRNQVINELLVCAGPVIDAIRSGVPHD